MIFSKINSSLLCGLVFVLVVAQAQASCPSNIIDVTPDSRYEIMADGQEVKDKKTGLIWQRCPVGMTFSNDICIGSPSSVTWEGALAYAASVGGGWRLPSNKELFSLMRIGCNNNRNLWAFPGSATESYPWGFVNWSSTPIKSNPETVLVSYQDMPSGSEYKYESAAFRLVRGE